MVIVKCPICELPMQRLRPSRRGEEPRQRGLPAGWDCPLHHAETVEPDDFENARVALLTKDITKALDEMRAERQAGTDFDGPPGP